jgi:hypothetical protein
MLLLVIIEERESVNIMVVMLGREVGQMCAERIYLDSSSRMTYFNSAILIDDLVELRSGFLSLGPGHMKGEPFILKNLLVVSRSQFGSYFDSPCWLLWSIKLGLLQFCIWSIELVCCS